jgi:hypothetical protein
LKAAYVLNESQQKTNFFTLVKAIDVKGTTVSALNYTGQDKDT